MSAGLGRDSAKHLDLRTESGIGVAEAISAVPFMDGDIVFRKGHDMMARMVLSQSGDIPKYSHVGIVVKRGSDSFVVHSVPSEPDQRGGVILEPVQQFASARNASHFAVYRLTTASDEQRRSIAGFAVTQVGKPFDDRFLLSESEHLYCSELVVKALRFGSGGSIQELPLVRVMMLAEPVLPPDFLRQSPQLTAIAEFQVGSR